MKYITKSLISILALWAGCNSIANMDEPPVLCELQDDHNECTADTCNEDGTTAHTNLLAGKNCTNGGTKCDGNGACVECFDAAECPGTDDECQQRRCVAGTCGFDFTAAETAIAAQLEGNCRVTVCDGAGATTESIDDADLPEDNNPCTTDTCDMGTLVSTNVPLGTGCGMAGNGDPLVCNDAGQCIGCNSPLDCPGITDECKARTCDASVCGMTFTLAGTPIQMQIAGDCLRVVCDGNGATAGENLDTDVLVDGNPCTRDLCLGGMPSNPNQPFDTLCSVGANDRCDGMGVCKKSNGLFCATDGECLSAHCADGVCCNSACTGLCQACTAALNGGTDGVCGAVPAGTDPDADCSNEPQGTCGKTGLCNGSGSCVLYPAGTECGAQSCAGTSQTNQDTCDGFGTCIDNGSKNCVPYSCGQTDCKTSCTSSADCTVGNGCVNQKCGTQLPTGASCTVAAECVSGYCVDGVCCSSTCIATCKACNLPGTVGTCSNIALGNDDNNATSTCSGTTQSCDGAGACKKEIGQSCSSSTQCLSAKCADGVCCNTSCSETCKSCNLSGTAGTCTYFPSGSDDTNATTTCSGTTQSCDGAGVCKKEIGQSCSSNVNCLSGYCVDGYCCNAACAGTCKACNVAGSLGTCSNIPLGQDDTNAATACAGTTQSCDGTGVCKKEIGQTCTYTADCFSGFCVDGVCCDNACSGTCYACTAILKGQGTNGTCGPVKVNTDASNECTNGSCDGSGACKLDNGQTCSTGSQCLNNGCCGSKCTNLQTDALNCGTCGRSCQGGACSNGVCQVLTVASGQNKPAYLAVDATHVYWTNQNDGTVKRVPLNGGMPVTLATGSAFPQQIAVNSTNVYWASSGVINKVSLTGTNFTQIATGEGETWGIALDATHVYWSSSDTDRIRKVALAGGTPSTVATGNLPRGIALDPTYVYWVRATTTGDVMRVNKNGSNTVTLTLPITSQYGPTVIALNATDIFWATKGASSGIMKMPKAGGSYVQLATITGGSSWGIAFDANYFYWTEELNGTVKKMPLAGGAPTLLASGQGQPIGIVVDNNAIYWTCLSGGQIQKLAK